MQTIFTLEKSDIIRIYNESSDTVKKLLEEKCGPEILTLKIEDRINSVDDAIMETGRKREEVIPFPNPINDFQDWLNSVAETAVLYEAFNEGKVPDWKNANQDKHLPWFRMNGSSGLGLSFGVAAYDNSSTRVASRLHLLNSKHVKVVADKFFPILERMMTQKAK